MNLMPRNLWSTVCGLSGAGTWPPVQVDAVARFFDYANTQCLLPLLMADEALPAQIQAMKPKYRLLVALQRKRTDLGVAAARELAQALGADAFLFYKGSDYRHRLYERPEYRLMGDIDTYVPARQIRATLARLEAQGYERAYARSTGSHAPGYHEKRVIVRGALVELHHSFGQRIRAGIDYDAMWRRRERFALDGVPACRLAPADAILGHAFNLGKDEFTPELNRYLDFYLLLQRHEDQLAVCVDRARQWGIERTLFGALHVTTALFPESRTAVATGSMEQLLDAPTRRLLIERVLPDAAREPSGNVLGRRVQLWRKFMLMDRTWRRVAFVGYHVYATGIGSLLRWQHRRKRASQSTG